VPAVVDIVVVVGFQAGLALLIRRRDDMLLTTLQAGSWESLWVVIERRVQRMGSRPRWPTLGCPARC
jgi:hypothetical protein